MTTNDFPFTVGDEVRLATWDSHYRVVVTAVGNSSFLGLNDAGHETPYLLCYPWERCSEPVVRKRWIVETELCWVDEGDLLVVATHDPPTWEIQPAERERLGNHIVTVEPLDE